MARRLNVDFLSMPEPRMSDHSLGNYLEAHYGAPVLAAIREPQYTSNGRRASPHGGALCMNLTAKQRGSSMRLLLSDQHGLLVHTIELPGFKPAALMTLYLPGPKSPQAGWVPGLLAAVRTQHGALARRFGHTNVFLSSDINGRASDLGGCRFTHDDADSCTQRDAQVAQLCVDLGISPLHGRTEATRAHVTSRCIDASVQKHDEQGKEVDYIFGSDQLSADRFDVLPLVPFPVEGAITHRFIGVTIRLEPAEEAPASPAADMPAERARPVRVPDYDDVDHYERSQRTILDGIRDPSFEALLAGGTSGAVLQAFESILTNAQREWAPADARQAAEAALRADPMHHVPTDGHARVAHRLYGGKQLPRATANVFADSRTKLSRAKKLRRRAATAASQGDRARHGSLTEEWTRLRTEGRELNRQARAQARQWFRQWEAGVTRVWEHRRKHNAADLWRQLNKAAPLDPETINAGGRMPALNAAQREVFWGFYKSLYTPSKDRSPLKGPTGPEWDAFIPRADGSKLGAVPTALEIYHALYPPHTDDAPSHDSCPSGLPSCAICATEAASFDWWDGDPNNTDDAPLQGPSLHASTAPGQDGLRPEVLRFSRNREPSQRRAERLEVCAVLARIYAQWHADSEVPAAACKSRSTPLFKDGDVLNPVDYRFLTIGDLLQKVWCIVMVRRLTHWAVGSGILSDSQAAFIPQHGCEQHVFTLTESIRWNWSRGRDVSALFIDLRKAYDMVRADALYPLLRKMGVAESLVCLLESRSRQRVSRLRVDGVDGPEVHMVDGVGQGDPLSCILFNLFMEPLLRSLDALSGTSGVAVGDLPASSGAAPRPGVRFRVLAFADDLVTPTCSPDELQLVLDHVLRWCDEWGMELGVKKTQAVHFPCPASRRAAAAAGHPPQLPELSATWRGVTSPIVWTESYRYLGFWMFGDLRLWGHRTKGGPRGGRGGKLVGGVGFMDEVSRRANYAFVRTIQAHSLIRLAPPALSLQVYRTAVSGCVNFLMSLVEPSAEVCRPLDQLSLKVARSSLRLKANCPNSLAWAESRLLPCEAILARERSRFLLQLQLSPLPSLAQRIYNALAWRYDPALHPKQWATTTLWTHRMLFLQGRYGKAGGPAAVVTHVGLAPARDEVVWSLPPPFVAAAWNPTALWHFVQLQPPPAPTTKHVPATVATTSHDASSRRLPAGKSHCRIYLYVDAKRAANVYGRAVALVLWQRKAAVAGRASAKRKGVPPGAPARTSADRPRPGPPVAHVADLHLSSESAPGLAASVGARKTITRASARGPGCSGAILALVNRQLSPRLLHMLGMLRQGRQGMFNYPLAAESRLPPKLPRAIKPKPTTRARAASAATSDTDDWDVAPAPSSAASVSSATSDLQGSVHSDAGAGPLAAPTRRTGTSEPQPAALAAQHSSDELADRTTPAFAAWARESSDWTATCTLCASGPEDTYHVLCECTHADVAAVRATVAAALPRKLVWVCRTVLAASSTPGQTAAERARGRARDVELVTALGAHLGVTSDGEAVEGAPALDWGSQELRFVLFRVLAVLPFPAAAAAKDHAVAGLVGAIFDRVTAKAHKLRPVANAWAGFAGSAVVRLFQAWNAAFAAQGGDLVG
jgi:hypothetical protein